MTLATMLLFPGICIHESPLPDVGQIAPARPRTSNALAFWILATLATFMGIAAAILTARIGVTLIALGFVEALGG